MLQAADVAYVCCYAYDNYCRVAELLKQKKQLRYVMDMMLRHACCGEANKRLGR